MITLYAAQGTSNMGDFLNCLPVLSGIYNSYGKINLIIQNDMKRFNGFRDLLSYQQMFDTVLFESEISSPVTCIPFNSWVDDFSLNDLYPIETSRYEKNLKFILPNLPFDVDFNFELEIPDLNVGERNIVVGDRCNNTTNDKRRSSDVIRSSGKFNDAEYLDFSNSCIYNANIIRKCKKFITTFTGIAILADLMDVPFDLYYTKDFDGWADQPAEFTYKKHFFQTRKSNLLLLDD